MARGKNIPPLDLMFYMTETAENPKHVGAIQIFELPPRAPAGYLSWLVAEYKKAKILPPFNMKPRFPRVGVPQWIEDKDIEIDYHIRHSAVPRPGTMNELMTVVERLHAGVLDHSRPGWMCQVIEGLQGNRFAVYTKIHHAYIDGMSGVKRMYGSLSDSRSNREVKPIWSFDPSEQKPERPGTRKKKAGLIERAEQSGKVALAQAKGITEMYATLAKLGLQALKLRESAVQLPFNAPRTPMNSPVKWNTRAIAACSLPLDRVRAVAMSAGGKVNDVVLTMVDAALRDYLVNRGEKIDKPLVALCPMSLREKGDHSANTQVATMHVRLGEADARLEERLKQVVESSRVTKEEARSMSREALMDMVLLLAGVMEVLGRLGLDQAVHPSYNVLVSNVPGPGGGRLYLAGSRLLAAHPISTLVPGGNLNVTVLSHGNNLDFGLIADKHALPDVGFIAERMEQHFAALEHRIARAKRPRAKDAAAEPKRRAAPAVNASGRSAQRTTRKAAGAPRTRKSRN